MSRRFRFLAASAALAGAPVATQAASPDEEIVVTGERGAERQAPAFVGAITVESDGQLARFAVPVCPASFGLLPAQNAYVAERLRLIARHVGIGAGAEGCRPNLFVVAAEDGEAFVDALREERPDLFAGFEFSEIRRIARLEGPARAWHAIEPRGADGRPVETISFIEHGDRLVYVGRARHLAGVMPSLTSRPTRQDLLMSVVVLDIAALEGLTPLQIADYAAMRALARTRPAAAARGRSILALFDPEAGGVPAELTGWDAAYLAGLYRAAGYVDARRHGAAIAGAIRRASWSGAADE